MGADTQQAKDVRFRSRIPAPDPFEDGEHKDEKSQELHAKAMVTASLHRECRPVA